jgi:glycosyltransferase involved in cell wall biosynthesis
MTQRILYVQYSNPAGYPPLEHSSRLLADAGWRVLFLGAGAPGTEALRLPAHPRIAVRRLPFCPPGWRQKLHYAWFAAWAAAWALRWRPGWVYASDHLACPVALLLSLLLGPLPGGRGRVVYHEHDAPPPAGAGAGGVFLRLCLAARRRLARRAALCVAPNRARARALAAAAGGPAAPAPAAAGGPAAGGPGPRVVAVWNCPARGEVAPPRPAPGPGPGPGGGAGLRVLYHGSIVPARLPPAVLEALARLPPGSRLRVVGYETLGNTGYVGQLQEAARRLGVGDRLEVLGAIPSRRELYERCRQCDVGLALMPKDSPNLNEQTMAGASNKPFDYLACGLAVLVADLPDWRRLYVEPGYGRACDPGDPASIAAALRWFLEHPGETRAMGERGRRRIAAEWNYETQFAPVFRRLTGGAGASEWDA